MGCEIVALFRLGCLAEAGAFLLAVVHQLIAAAMQHAQPFALRLNRQIGPWTQAFGHHGQHPGVDRVGLGEKAGGTGEVAGAQGIDARESYAGGMQSHLQLPVIAPGCLEHDKHSPAAPALGECCDRRRCIGDALMAPRRRIEDVEARFGNVDSNEDLRYSHGACPCDARSAVNGLVQLFR